MLEHVWVLVIDYRHGTAITAHASRTSAWQELFDYVGENWCAMFNVDEEPLLLTKAHVEQYFAQSRETGWVESYEILECQVRGEKDPAKAL